MGMYEKGVLVVVKVGVSLGTFQAIQWVVGGIHMCEDNFGYGGGTEL